jgi:GAF domain-containing protein
LKNTGAERVCLILQEKGKKTFQFLAETSTLRGSVLVHINEPLTQCDDLLIVKVVNRAIRSRKAVMIDNACANSDLASTKYVSNYGIKSVMCTPIIHEMKVTGVLYLENNKMNSVFTEHRSVLLSTIIEVSIDNAELFTTLNSSFARFLPKPFLEQLKKKSVTEVMAGDAVEKNMTVLFSDVSLTLFFD